MPEDQGSCPICGDRADLMPAGGNIRVRCPRCGTFAITEDAVIELKEKPLQGQVAAAASGWIAESAPGLIRTYSLPQLRTRKPLSIQSRLDRLLTKLTGDTKILGENVSLAKPEVMGAYIAATYSQGERELCILIEHLASLGRLRITGSWDKPLVTPEGFAYVEEHLVRNTESSVAFCAMWFNDEVLSLWTDAIRPAIEGAGYEAVRVDGVEHNNRIDDEIVAQIRQSRFLVADLTGHRQGVYFEAGLGMGLGLPVVWMVRQDQLQQTHFDNRQYNFILWTPDTLEEAKQRLRNRIEATIGRGPHAT